MQYTQSTKGLINKGTRYYLHPTKYVVKLLSGKNTGARAFVDTAEQAKAECMYQADNHNICATWYPPANGE